MHKYLIAGWSSKYGSWQTEVIEAGCKESARRQFVALMPNLKNIKAYTLANGQPDKY